MEILGNAVAKRSQWSAAELQSDFRRLFGFDALFNFSHLFLKAFRTITMGKVNV
jgi:hypothetical protein